MLEVAIVEVGAVVAGERHDAPSLERFAPAPPGELAQPRVTRRGNGRTSNPCDSIASRSAARAWWSLVRGSFPVIDIA
jgi:hypothetical protein